jgi:hypothetical protein
MDKSHPIMETDIQRLNQILNFVQCIQATEKRRGAIQIYEADHKEDGQEDLITPTGL